MDPKFLVLQNILSHSCDCIETQDKEHGEIWLITCVKNLCKTLELNTSSTDNDRKTEIQFYSDIVYEKLHSKHWKEVGILSRKLYSLLSVLKLVECVSSATEEEMLRICDMAILLGAPIYENILHRIASKLQQIINTNNQMTDEVKLNDELSLTSSSAIFLPGPQNKIRVTNLYPSLPDFIMNHFNCSNPLLIKGAIEDWPAFTKWNVNYFKNNYGSRLVPVEIGSKYTASDWRQKLMTIREFVQNYILQSNNEKGYLAQHNLFDQIPELLDDIILPELTQVGVDENVDINAWFGPAGTLTPTHYDPKHNFLTQIFGRKFIRLFPPSSTSCLYPYPNGDILSNTSQIDMEDPESLLKYPKLIQAEYVDFILEKGDILYIPPKYWHNVQSLTPSFSVSFWFQ